MDQPTFIMQSEWARTPKEAKQASKQAINFQEKLLVVVNYLTINQSLRIEWFYRSFLVGGGWARPKKNYSAGEEWNDLESWS